MKTIICCFALLASCLSAPSAISQPIEFETIEPQEAPQVGSALGFAVDFSAASTLSQLQCVKQSGYNVAFIRAYDPSGQGRFDVNAVQNIRNAYKAGLGIEVYLTPQPASTKQGYQQLDEMYNGLTSNGITVRSVWIQVTSPVNWPGKVQAHINFLNSIISRARQLGLSVGVYTNNYDWNQITSGWRTIGTDVMLWYWNVLGGGVKGETPANFGDFRAFGSWSRPAMKQFAQVELVCQLTVNRDVYEVSQAKSQRSNLTKDQGVPVVGGFVGF